MKQVFILIASLFVANFGFAQDKKQISSDIKQVTVFQNKAQMTNTATTTVDAGVTEITIGGLSQFVEQNSVQVTGKGDFTILGVKQKINYINSTKKTPEFIELEDTTEKIKFSIEHLRDKIHIYEKEEQMILANQQVGGKDKALTADEFEEYLDLFRDRLTEIRNSKSKTQREIVKKEEVYNKFFAQLQSILNQQNKPTTEVTVTVSSKTRATIGLEMTFLVGNVGWQPIYDLRSKNTSSPMQLIYKANVYQNTGVDWERVKIKLSTGNPSLNGAKPELGTWYVDIEQPIVQTRMYKSGSAKKEMAVMDDLNKMDREGVYELEAAAPAVVFANTSADYTTTTEYAVSVEFDVAVPYSVPSDGNAVLMDVQTYQIPVQYKHYTAPKLDTDVFLTALLTNWEQYNLIPGNANVYFEGTFVGETYLDLSNTNDTLMVSLGRDKKVIVKRESVKDFTSKSFFGGTKKIEHAFEIEVRNTKKDSVSLVIEDQIPISKNNEIEVEILDLAGAELNKETGKLVWRVSLNAGESKKVTFRFTIKHPKGKNIVNY